MKVLSRLSSILAGIITSIVATAMYLYPPAPVYVEGKVFIGVLSLGVGLFVVISNIVYLYIERGEDDD